MDYKSVDPVLVALAPNDPTSKMFEHVARHNSAVSARRPLQVRRRAETLVRADGLCDVAFQLLRTADAVRKIILQPHASIAGAKLVTSLPGHGTFEVEVLPGRECLPDFIPIPAFATTCLVLTGASPDELVLEASAEYLMADSETRIVQESETALEFFTAMSQGTTRVDLPSRVTLRLPTSTCNITSHPFFAHGYAAAVNAPAALFANRCSGSAGRELGRVGGAPSGLRDLIVGEVGPTAYPFTDFSLQFDREPPFNVTFDVAEKLY